MARNNMNERGSQNALLISICSYDDTALFEAGESNDPSHFAFVVSLIEF
jgi:hypothetical protein